MVSSRRSQSNNHTNNGLVTSTKDHNTTYETLMGQEGGHTALTDRLISFRKWIQNAGCQVHPAICIVNGEATDGTKNAPVLVLGPPPSMSTSSSAISSATLKTTTAVSTSAASTTTTTTTAISALAASKPVSSTEGRCGLVDKEEDRMLYDRTIGCQIRTTREIKEGQVMMKIPRTVMIHADLIAGSDVGRIALACCEPLEDESNFWDAFGHTATIQETHLNKASSSGGTQLLVKILQERKKAETILAKAAKAVEEGNIGDYTLASKGTISARAVYLLFLIQQRFSDELEPRVTTNCDFRQHSTKDDASTHVKRIKLAQGTPDTFAPYARTLPPSVPLPMCWKRNELATLASCIPGLPLMQEITAQILTFSSDLIALVEAGILYRFPSIISPKLLTWDRWIWAGSVHMSRALPSMCYLNRGEDSPKNHIVAPGELFYSPPQVWKDLGVMVPLVDMLNHEAQESQIKWVSPKAHRNGDNDAEDDGFEMATDEKDDDVAKILIQKRVKKGAQIYTTYNIECNQNLILQYGFAQMANDSDTVQIGWALQDGVGQCSKPSDYYPINREESSGLEADEFVYESSDLDTVNSWWTEDRMEVLQKAMTADSNFWKNLRNGKKMVSAAYSDGTYEPKLLTALVVATMSPGDVKKFLAASSVSNRNEKITLTKRHQRILRHYMLFLFSRKLERLLQNIGNGLKAHFNNFELWTKVTEGGLDYSGGNRDQDTNGNLESSEGAFKYIGWNSFFDAFAYSTSMEVETRYYALAPESCVLTLYDGHLRALQKSIDGVATEDEFQKSVAPALQDLDFILSNAEERNIEFQDSQNEKVDLSEKSIKNSLQTDDKATVSENSDQKKPTSQRQSKKLGQPSIKLHIGNLSYQTTPTSLSNYFASRYGRENVLECHIPTERDTGKSRGFGFITLVERFALKILHENLPHNIDGRVVKIAESNTSIQARGGQLGGAPGASNERCSKCGYRPRYCTCSLSGNSSTFQNRGDIQAPIPPHSSQSYSLVGPYGPRPGDLYPLTGDHESRGYDRVAESRASYDDRRRGRSFRRDRSISQSPPPVHRPHRDAKAYDGYYNYGQRRSLSNSRYGNNYGRSRSRSMSIDRERGSRRSDSYEKDSRRNRKSRSSRKSSRYNRSRSRSFNRSNSSSISRDVSERDGRRKREVPNHNRSYSNNSNIPSKSERSRSNTVQGQNADENMMEREETKRYDRDKSRSRDRSHRSRPRRHSSKRSRKDKERSRQRNRSFSRSRSRSYSR
jgi:hypothetical protein